MRKDWNPDAYDYAFPDSLIAQQPVKPRDAARLLVYSREDGSTTHRTFTDLPDLLEPGSVLVVNDTKVITARFEARKETGGAVRILFLKSRGARFEALADRTLAAGSRVQLPGKRSLRVVSRDGATYVLEPDFEDLDAFLARYGTVPLPPYIKSRPLSASATRAAYQSVVARAAGSAAAPTASLHLTNRLIKKLEAKGVRVVTITLHVGLGTFAPLTAEQVEAGALHREWYEVPAGAARAIARAKASGKPVVAVGTTVARALESSGGVASRGETDLFIRPGYEFRVVDQLVTNFHVPRSSLMQLVASLTGRGELLRAYGEAVRERYRLFSFGDAMLIR